MKNYRKDQYTGNENGWREPIKALGIVSIHEDTASELNTHFRNTGIKYEETTEKPSEFTTTDQADHGEKNLVVKGNKFVTTKNKPKDKKKAVEKENKEGKATAQKPAPATADDAFVKSDGEIKHAATKEGTGEANQIEGGANTPE